MINDLAGIAEVSFPKGFEKTVEDSDFGYYVEYRRGPSKICYWQKENFFASSEALGTIQDSLKRDPHFIFLRNLKDPHEPSVDDEEYFAAAEALLQPGRALPPFGFDIRNLRTDKLNGKQVFRADFDANRHFTSILMWDPLPDWNILRHLWIVGPRGDEEKLLKEFSRVCSTIQWVA